ncbi:MAG: NAD(P)-binding domain-containing protein [Psychrobium sp.]
MNNSHHTIVIGAGHAGLAAGYYLKQQNINFTIIESNARVGDQWRNRFAGLALFTPNALNRLPGYIEPMSQGRYQTKDEFADYLEQYSIHHQLPMLLGQEVKQITRLNNSQYCIELPNQTLISNHIILATGAFKDIAIPQFSSEFTGLQLTINQLARCELKNQRVLVVGDGASGRQVAKKLNENNIVALAQGKKRNLIRETVLGVSSFRWLKWLGILRLPKTWAVAKWLKQRDPFPDTQINDKALRLCGIELMPKLTAFDPQASFVNGEKRSFDTVIWATGYNNKAMPIIDEKNDSESLNDNIWSLGQAWQFNRASGLIYGAQFDAKIIVDKILKR